MEATSTAGPGGAGVAIKFRAATVATEKRAAVRAAIQQLPAAARSAETEKSSPRASMRDRFFLIREMLATSLPRFYIALSHQILESNCRF